MFYSMKNIVYKLLEVSPPHTKTPGITYIVTFDNVVLYCPFYTRHKAVMEVSEYSIKEISWGGILDTRGNWVRRSIDYGDAPNKELREVVRNLLAQKLT